MRRRRRSLLIYLDIHFYLPFKHEITYTDKTGYISDSVYKIDPVWLSSSIMRKMYFKQGTLRVEKVIQQRQINARAQEGFLQRAFHPRQLSNQHSGLSSMSLVKSSFQHQICHPIVWSRSVFKINLNQESFKNGLQAAALKMQFAFFFS